MQRTLDDVVVEPAVGQQSVGVRADIVGRKDRPVDIVKCNTMSPTSWELISAAGTSSSVARARRCEPSVFPAITLQPQGRDHPLSVARMGIRYPHRQVVLLSRQGRGEIISGRDGARRRARRRSLRRGDRARACRGRLHRRRDVGARGAPSLQAGLSIRALFAVVCDMGLAGDYASPPGLSRPSPRIMNSTSQSVY
jgi:hypothetical protein